MHKKMKIIMMVDDGVFSTMMYNALKESFDIQHVIMESPVSKKKLLKNRVKKLGLPTVIGQLLFILYSKLSAPFNVKQIQKIQTQFSLNTQAYPDTVLKKVSSINDDTVIQLLQTLQPDIIIVNGTRIISQKILDASAATFINTHAGITPRYRGVHGGYWALTQDDKENCGVTVHLVDKGIDTGGILYQSTIEINHHDSYHTYPYHQLGKAVSLMKLAIKDCINSDIKVQKRDDLDSKLWSHPTLWQYLFYRLTKGVK